MITWTSNGNWRASYDEPKIRLTAAFFAEVVMLPSGNVEYVRLDRVERWLLEKDHEIALMMNRLLSE